MSKPASLMKALVTDKKELLGSTDAVIDGLVNDLQTAGRRIAYLEALLEQHGIPLN